MNSLALKTLLFLSVAAAAATLDQRPPPVFLIRAYREKTAEFDELLKMTGLSKRNKAEVVKALHLQFSKELEELKSVDELYLDEVSRAVENLEKMNKFLMEEIEWRKRNWAELIVQAMEWFKERVRYV